MGLIQQVRDLSKDGKSQYEIAHYLGKSCKEISEIVGNDILELRSQKMSLKDIAKLTGYTKSNVSKWINKIKNNNDIIKELRKKRSNNDLETIEELEEKRIKRNKERNNIKSTILKASINRKKKRLNKKRSLVKLCGGKCCNCGYNKHTGSLEFHHIDESKKLFSIRSNYLSRSAIDIANEVNKCALLCANCHREIHADVDIFGYISDIKLVKCIVDYKDLIDIFGE